MEKNSIIVFVIENLQSAWGWVCKNRLAGRVIDEILTVLTVAGIRRKRTGSGQQTAGPL